MTLVVLGIKICCKAIDIPQCILIMTDREAFMKLLILIYMTFASFSTVQIKLNSQLITTSVLCWRYCAIIINKPMETAFLPLVLLWEIKVLCRKKLCIWAFFEFQVFTKKHLPYIYIYSIHFIINYIIVLDYKYAIYCKCLYSSVITHRQISNF